MAEGTQEEVWGSRRSKSPLLGRARGGGVDCHRNIFPCTCKESQKAGYLWRMLQVARKHCCRLWVTRHYLCEYGWPGISCVG